MPAACFVAFESENVKRENSAWLLKANSEIHEKFCFYHQRIGGWSTIMPQHQHWHGGVGLWSNSKWKKIFAMRV